jgi:CBS domain containing-hemolysin-like protein
MSLGHVALLSSIFILINAVFVAAEFALLAAPRASFEHQAAEGDAFARRVVDVLTSPTQQDRYVATAQLAITVASLGLGMYGEHGLARLLEPYTGPVPYVGGAALASVIALAVLTVAHIVFGEMVPKGLALQHPDGAARLAYWPMRVTLMILYPFVATATGVARGCLRIFGIKRGENTEEQVYTPEELQLIVEESQAGGALRADAGKILSELFEFGDRTASQAMVPRVRVVGIPVGAAPDELRRIVMRYRRTRYPVYEGDLDHVIGMLHVKELLRRVINNEAVSTADARRIPFVPETATLDDVLAEMNRMHAHMAVVIDEHGGTAGMVSLEDLFEEVVGEIDEGAPVTPPVVKNADGSVCAVGTLRLDELGKQFDLDVEHEEVESVSGLVLEQLGRPPIVGDEITYGRVHLEVTAVSGRGVREVRATLVPEPRNDADES